MFKNNKAFSLIEVLIAAGLVSIVSLAIMSLVSSTTQSQRSIQAKDIQRDVMSEISRLLTDPVACTNTFGGNDPATAFAVNHLKDASAPPLNKFSVGATHGSDLLQYTEFGLQEWVADATAPNQGMSKLKVRLTKTGNTIGVKDIEQKLNILIKLDAAHKIITCYVIGNSSEYWKASPINIADIYYNGGNVGIGTSTPAVSLDVNGAIRPGNGLTGAACTDEGAFAYDNVAHAPVYCSNANVWTVMGGGNISIDVWRCPFTTFCDDGRNVSGAWASYTCQGQIQSRASCSQIWFNGGTSHICENACVYLGKLRVN